MKSWIQTGAIACLALAVTSTTPAQQDGQSPPADRYNADVASAWADQLYDAVRFQPQPPMVASRAIGYWGVAFYESVVPGMREHRSLAGQLNALTKLPKVNQGVAYHWPSAANAASAAVLRGLYTNAGVLASIDALEQAFIDDFASPPKQVPDAVAQRSRNFGQAIAAAVLAWAAQDGFAEYNNCPYTAPVGPGLWEPTPPAFAPPAQPCWGRLRTFGIVFPGQCTAGPHIAFSTDPSSAFYAAANEVYTVSQTLTADQINIAQFWADGPGTGTPPGHWVRILRQVTQQHGYDLAVAAEGYARIGLGVADAFIACWNDKYTYNLLRPITYINDYIDAAWVPLIVTPPFPSYSSGHSSQSGAASSLLTDLLGDVTFTDDTGTLYGFGTRSFTSFTQASDEAAVSRLYGGIHYSFDNNMGLAAGREISDIILQRVKFRK
ncbi:MAG: phosphatase PAP2 family protein [Planctomycetota bacterium]|nr:MAG: phosphatase PAP2 family protein [Planctomycetota bacterium]